MMQNVEVSIHYCPLDLHHPNVELFLSKHINGHSWLHYEGGIAIIIFRFFVIKTLIICKFLHYLFWQQEEKGTIHQEVGFCHHTL